MNRANVISQTSGSFLANVSFNTSEQGQIRPDSCRKTRQKVGLPGRRSCDLHPFLYAGPGQAPLSGSSEEKSLCHYTNAVIPGEYVSRHPVAAKYADLLELPTSEKPRSTTTI